MKVYDPEGNAHEKDPVDARECVEHCGYSYEPPEVAKDDGKNQNAKAPPKKEEKADGAK